MPGAARQGRRCLPELGFGQVVSAGHGVQVEVFPAGADRLPSDAGAPVHAPADSHAWHSALAKYIWRGVRQDTRIRLALATMTASALALDVATFSRCGSYRNSRPRGASSAEEVAIE